MLRAAAPLLAVLAGCASPPAGSPPIAFRWVPSFRDDGSLRRDPATDAPLFQAPPGARGTRPPRFRDDGTVCRDPETGALLCDEEAGGRVIRVLLLPCR